MARQPEVGFDFIRRIEALERAVQQERQRNPFFGSGFHLTGANGIESDDFDGDLAAGNAGSRGWSLNSVRAAIGELFLRPGSIGNDILTNPVEPKSAHDDASTFSVGSAFGSILSVTIPVPTGFTRALILNMSTNASAINTDTSTAWLYCRSVVSGFPGQGWSVGSADTPAGETAVAFDLQTRLLEGVADQITVSGQVTTNGTPAWTAHPANVANLDVSILFLR